ncbi:MAG: glycoside hydrolase family 2 TIM barrel-domain containing protein [Planctomycetota bacterium]
MRSALSSSVRWWVHAVLLVCCLGAAGQPTDMWLRRTLPLNGDWPVIVDPIDHGSVDYRSRRRDLFAADTRDDGRYGLVEFSWDDEHTLAVPGDWNSQDERLFFYEGAVWYRKVFELGESGWSGDDGERLWLCFGGANRLTTVWVNGEKVGENGVGFTPFSFDVTGAVREGENMVVARVDNRRAFEAVPGEIYDWWNYGGLTRDVWLATSPGVYVSGWRLWLDGGVIRGEVAVAGDGPPGDADAVVEVLVDELGIAERVELVGGRGSFSVPAVGVERWSPERPRLYEVRVVGPGGDVLVDRMGFREIETEGGRVLLNGEPVVLRGVSIHEEAPFGGGRSVGEADARVLLGWAKELGCNFVRLAHYTHNEHTVRLAEELGLMVWAEIPVYWILDFENPATLAEAKAHLDGMIDRDRNRSNIVIWSIGNETGDAPEVTRFRRRLGEHVKRRDPTRLLSAAMFARQVREPWGAGGDGGAIAKRDGSAGERLVKLVVDDPFGEIADVLAINSYIGWYHDRPDEIAGVGVELAWDKPLMLSEFGAGVKQGRRGSADERWTEEYGLSVYGHTLRWAESLPNFAGMSPWTLHDFRSPRRPRYGVQDWYNRKGLISETGEKKLVYGLLAGWYGEMIDTNNNE